MKASVKAKIAVIGGSGFERLLGGAQQIRVGTPYGVPPPLLLGRVEGREVIFLPRHGPDHSVPPHRVNYRANIYALHQMGVERVIAINAVGAINCDFRPGDIVIPHDLVDFTKARPSTFYDSAPVTHIDFSKPFCPEIRGILAEKSAEAGVRFWDKAVLVCTEGPRFETAAEIEMFRRLGFDIVGMTTLPEAVLARELEMCYASLCFVSNMAAGMQERLTSMEVIEVSRKINAYIERILTETVKAMPVERSGLCPCAHALKDARLQ